MQRYLRLWMAVAWLVYAGPVTPVHAQEELIRWEGDGLKLETQPLTLDQIRGFFIGREFSTKQADLIARDGCVFRSAIGSSATNPDSGEVTLDLKDWRVIVDGKPHPLRTREQWDVLWKNMKASEEARVAFRWALFPTQQRFGPTDYNWGMLSFAQPPGTTFDLAVTWRFAGSQHHHTFKGLNCAK